MRVTIEISDEEAAELRRGEWRGLIGGNCEELLSKIQLAVPVGALPGKAE